MDKGEKMGKGATAARGALTSRQTARLRVHVDGNDARQRTQIDGDLLQTALHGLAVVQHVSVVRIGPEHAVRKHRHRRRRLTVPVHTPTDVSLSDEQAIMASAEREPITGVRGGATSGVQGPNQWSVGQGRSPLKLKAF